MFVSAASSLLSSALTYLLFFKFQSILAVTKICNVRKITASDVNVAKDKLFSTASVAVDEFAIWYSPEVVYMVVVAVVFVVSD